MTAQWSGRARDAALAAALFAFALPLSVLVPETRVGWLPLPPAPPVGLVAVALAVACLGVSLRRARPLLGAGACLVAVVGSAVSMRQIDPGSALATVDIVFCMVRYGSARLSRTVVAGSAVLVGAAVLAALVGGGLQAGLHTMLIGLAFPVVPVWWALDVRQHWLMALRESERAAQARHSAVAAERARMARELHDSVAGQLSVIALQSEAALSLTDDDPAMLRRILTAVRETSVTSLEDMRAMIGVLRSADDPTESAAPAPVQRLVDDARASGLHVELADERGETSQPHAVQLGISRIVQEALTNAAKHAPGSAVRVALTDHGTELEIEVTNDLVADAPAGGGTGTGLLSLRERAHAAGGSIEAGANGGRWRLHAVLPHEPVGAAS